MAGYQPQDFNFAFSSEKFQQEIRSRGGIRRKRKEKRIDFDRRVTANEDLQQAFTDKFNQVSNAFPGIELPMPNGKITKSFAQSFVYGKKSDQIDEIVNIFGNDKVTNNAENAGIHQTDLLTFISDESTSLINFINNGEKMINLLSTSMGKNVRGLSSISFNYVHYLLNDKGLMV